MKVIFCVLIALVPCALGLLEANLGDACSSAADCAPAYSTCKNKKCTCIDAFTATKGLCVPPAKQCPTFDCPPGFECTFDAGKACEHRIDTNGKESHTCNDVTEFCFVHPNEKNQQGASVGHCCKRPPNGVGNIKMVCPYKASDPKGTCPDTSNLPVDSVAPPSLTRTCSYVTHDCVKHFKQSACCPIPCHGASSHFSVEGKCYDYVQIGDACNYPVQCIGGSDCIRAPSKSTGKGCLCPKGEVIDEPSPHCGTPATQGAQSVQIGDACNSTEQCAGGAKCVRAPSKPTGRACLCDNQTPGATTCTPTPTAKGVNKVKTGDDCNSTDQCPEGAKCVRAPSRPSGRACFCDNPGPAGAATCASASTAQGANSVKIGDACNSTDQCAGGAKCARTPRTPTGRSCLCDNSDTPAGATTCSPAPDTSSRNSIPVGKPCNETIQCKDSGICTKSGSSPTGRVCIAS